MGEIKVKALLTIFIKDLLDAFNVVRPMNDTQVAGLIDLILQTYPYFKPEDFRLCFDRLKIGYYKIKVLDRIDAPLIFQALNLHAEERAELAEIQSSAGHDHNKSKPIELHPKILDKLKEALPEILSTKSSTVRATPQDTSDELSKSDTRQQADSTVVTWMKEFDELHSAQRSSPADDGKGIRLVFYDGRRMDNDSFLNCKLKEYKLKNNIK